MVEQLRAMSSGSAAARHRHRRPIPFKENRARRKAATLAGMTSAAIDGTPMLRAPVKKFIGGVGIRPSGVRVANVGREEIEEAASTRARRRRPRAPGEWAN
jgi:hypothetical protein